MSSSPIAVPEQRLTFCGAQPEQLRNGRRPQSRWMKRHLTWCIINRLPQLTLEQQVRDTEWALHQYRVASNGWFSYEQTDKPDSADIILTTFRDRPYGVLADMQLPPGDDRQLLGRFDSAEDWNRTLQSVQYKLTAMHELGHAHGMDHIDDPRAQSVLDSQYNGALLKLQPLDVEVILNKYPEARGLAPIDPTWPPVAPTPAPVPSPIPTPAPPASSPFDGPVVINFANGETWRATEFQRIF